ncbi:oxidoreductase [Reinekea sp.]|jgi:NAD(P)-dependent dehydrogenase (short-subunit alcohol dehydrogenase family)|uniref:oxidoreductase n=1 Tax=Reinekea sp. TaxID=1970455 RepID=UPI002A81C90C|nr:oxidoreductase [Reinekea sp.]
MATLNWNTSNITDQSGRVVIITGATSGLGKEATKILAGKNATVVMAVRNTEKGALVATELKSAFPSAKIDVRSLDLGSLSSVKDFAAGIHAAYDRLDILINNAGVMTCPYSKTEDDFEIQMGTNHFGHFALTGLLMPLLTKTKASRIVATSSIAHKQGKIDLEDINWEKRKYSTMQAYGDSKMANLYFAYELASKLKDDPSAPLVTAAHPGWTSTELQRHSIMFRLFNPLFSQNVAQGVLPTLRAAIDEHAKPGDYFGPSGFQELKGSPVVVKSTGLSHSDANAKKLWALSEEMTGVQF